MTGPAEIPEVDVEEAAVQLAAGALLVDVREPAEWQAGHIEDALHIPLGQLGPRQDEIDATRALLIVCRSGGRSAEATLALNGAGYDAKNVAGGLQAWVAAGKPIEPESGFVA